MPSKHLSLKGSQQGWRQETHKTLMNWETPKLLRSHSPTQGPHAEGPGWKVPRIPWKGSFAKLISWREKGGNSTIFGLSQPHLTHCLQKGVCTLLWSPDFCGCYQGPPRLWITQLWWPAGLTLEVPLGLIWSLWHWPQLSILLDEGPLLKNKGWFSTFFSTTFPPERETLCIIPSKKGEDMDLTGRI